MIFSSCKGCTDRTVGCHADCPRYLADKAKRDEQAELIRRERGKDCAINKYVSDMKRKIRKRKRLERR